MVSTSVPSQSTRSEREGGEKRQRMVQWGRGCRTVSRDDGRGGETSAWDAFSSAAAKRRRAQTRNFASGRRTEHERDGVLKTAPSRVGSRDVSHIQRVRSRGGQCRRSLSLADFSSAPRRPGTERPRVGAVMRILSDRPPRRRAPYVNGEKKALFAPDLALRPARKVS